MIIVGDIGNTETKVCLIDKSNKIIKKMIIKTKNINGKVNPVSRINLFEELYENFIW